MGRRSATLRGGVPFLPEKQIEQEAELLLAEYGERFGEIAEPPVPIDEMIELHLRLAFEIADLRELFGAGDIHGAIWINEERIAVDRSLDLTRISHHAVSGIGFGGFGSKDGVLDRFCNGRRSDLLPGTVSGAL